METKNGSLLKDSKGKISKAKIGSLLVTLAGGLTIVGQFLQGQVDYSVLIQGAMAMCAGFGMYGLRDAQK